jgi:hypothetical protein
VKSSSNGRKREKQYKCNKYMYHEEKQLEAKKEKHKN